MSIWRRFRSYTKAEKEVRTATSKKGIAITQKGGEMGPHPRNQVAEAQW
jgi:hypothetical protein